ncbi:unnamed protein product [Caenorhabditis sp. 36 PRJEB53466]|nr:unnamed protein product [Caenorhabditis sp. 36 PRJEB53466]
MIHSLQLLIIYSCFLNTVFAQISSTCNRSTDCVTTFSFDETRCSIRVHEASAISSTAPMQKIFKKMTQESIRTPQCYIQPVFDNSSLVSCFCDKSFHASCYDYRAMAESVYQWKRDRRSRVGGSTDHKMSKNILKVGCLLKGFSKLREGKQAKAYVYELDGQTCVGRLKSTRISSEDKTVNVECTSPTKLYSTVFCRKDDCFQSDIQKENDLLISWKAFLSFQDAVDQRNVSDITHKSCSSIQMTAAMCSLKSFRENVENTVAFTASYGLPIDKMGRERLSWSVKDRTADAPPSQNHIYSWLIVSLYIIPFLLIFLMSTCSCGDIYRCDLITNSTQQLKDIELMLTENLGKKPEAERKALTVTKEKSEIIHQNVTTISTMGNLTDLGSEGPVATSLRTVKGNAEDGKDVTRDDTILA